MGTATKPPGKAMYVASQSDKDWLRSVQRKLYQRSQENPGYVFRKLWGLVTEPRNLRIAVARVAGNRGQRTAGIDGITVRMALRAGVDHLVASLREKLRSRSFLPSPVRRVSIPKRGQPGKYRALGIPTVEDRVVQAAVKNILEPIFEADFLPVSFGFRPGKSVHAALEQLRILLRPRGTERTLPYQWAIEGDIRGCFDNIDHHALMKRVRRRVEDIRVTRLLRAFLKAGVLSEGSFFRTDSGTPQGGILSPLLANVALAAIEERYERHVWPRGHTAERTATIRKRASHTRERMRKRGAVVFYPIRYADDFIILVSATHGPEQEAAARGAAHQEKAELARVLRLELGLDLSEAKTLVTSVTRPMRFLGHTVRVRPHPVHGRMVSTAVVPKDKGQELRCRIKGLFRRATTKAPLADLLRELNPMLRGWGNFYRHAWGAKKVFTALDHYVWWSTLRWLRKKYPHASMRELKARHGWRQPRQRMLRWRDGSVQPFQASSIRVEPYRLAWLNPPDFVTTYGKPGAQRKVHAGFGKGAPRDRRP